MKIRTTENLLDRVDQDFAWRKKELATLKLVIDRYAFKPRLLNTALRAGITLLYAHWEGFLKTSSEFYLEYVSNQGVTNNQLADNILALAARKPINDMAASPRVDQALALVDFFRRKMAHPADVPHKDIIKTKANLSSGILRDISSTVGVNYALFETKATLIDERLVYKRNRRAWGWINRRAFTQTNCAWCQSPKVMRRAWITARITSHTICPACREAMLRDATIFNA
jgi:hypothetical protein